MTAETIYEVITALIGEVEPVADTYHDAIRRDNMKVFIEVFDKMHNVIDEIAYKHKNSSFASCKEIGQLCAKHIDKMGITD